LEDGQGIEGGTKTKIDFDRTHRRGIKISKMISKDSVINKDKRREITNIIL
jgi:hypothetical protein